MTKPLPTRAQVAKLGAMVADMPVERITDRLAVLVERERRHGTNVPDGMPRSSMAGGSSGGGPTVLVDGDQVPVTSVEAAVIARERPPVDRQRRAVLEAVDALGAALDALRRAEHRLNLVDALRSDEELTPEPGCWAMARVGAWEPVHRKTFVGDEERALGRFAYDFVRRAGRLPTIEECRAHSEGRRIHLPTGGRQ